MALITHSLLTFVTITQNSYILIIKFNLIVNMQLINLKHHSTYLIPNPNYFKQSILQLMSYHDTYNAIIGSTVCAITTSVSCKYLLNI